MEVFELETEFMEYLKKTIGNTIENDKFDFLLDGETVPDMKIVDIVQIN